MRQKIMQNAIFNCKIKKRFSVSLCCCISLSLLLTSGAAFARENFNDVDESFWGYSVIMELSDKGVISGDDNNMFKPDENITREAFIKLLMAAGSDEITDMDSFNSQMADVDAGRWSHAYVASAIQKNVLNERDLIGGAFRPADALSRADVAKWVSRFVPPSDDLDYLGVFPDVTDSEVDYCASYLYNCGIISGDTDGNYHPDDALTRAQAASIIKNVLDYIEEWGVSSVADNTSSSSLGGVSYKDNVLVLSSMRVVNILSENYDTYCVFTNTDDDLQLLRHGNVIVVPPCEQAPQGDIINVDNISVEDTRVVIYKGAALQHRDILK